MLRRTILSLLVVAALAGAAAAQYLMAIPNAPPSLQHEITLHNDSLATVDGLQKFGLAFEKGDVPDGSILQVTVDDAEVPSAMVSVATYSDGSLRKCTLAVDVGSVAAETSVDIEVKSATGTQATNNFDVAAFVAGLSDDCTVAVTSRTGSSTGSMSDLTYSLQTAFTDTDRFEVVDNTELLVRAKCWQKLAGEEHLVCMNYLDIWLDNDTVIGWAWVPVLSQHWWVNDPFGDEQTKEEYTYDASVSADGSTVDTRSDLVHDYYCRWASLYSGDDDQHATPHWISVTADKPTLRVEYSTASRKHMARAGGYMPPLNWTNSGWTLTATDDYTPLGTNGHRAAIDSVGGYDGRGQITRMDANAILLQTAAAWRVMRVAAQAGLSMHNGFYDHRVAADDSEPFMRLIPQKFAVLGAQSYTGLGAEANHSKGASYDTNQKDIFEDAPVGGTGAFIQYDNAHAVPYASFAAFILGENYLADAALPQADFAMCYTHMNIYGHNKSFEWVLTGYGNAQGVPLTPRHGTIPIPGSQRSRAWGQNQLMWAWANCADNDPHQAYLQTAIENFDDFLEVSYPYFHADHIAYGGWSWSESCYYSPWMHALTVMVASQWRAHVDDMGFGEGYDIMVQMAAKPIVRGIANDRIGALEAYAFCLPVGTTYHSAATGWIASEGGLFPIHSATWGSGQITITPQVYGVTNGDRILVSNAGTTEGPVDKPTELDYTTIYYVINASGNTFELSATPGGSAITITGSGTTALGMDLQEYDSTVSATNTGGDSYAMITWAAIVAAYLAGDQGVDAADVAAYKTYLSTSTTEGWAPWDYSEEQN